jgi:hypothetical protein
VQTRPINRPISAPNSLIFAASKLILPQEEADREDLGPEWTEGVTGLLCRGQVENKKHFVGPGPCGPILDI